MTPDGHIAISIYQYISQLSSEKLCGADYGNEHRDSQLDNVWEALEHSLLNVVSLSNPFPQGSGFYAEE